MTRGLHIDRERAIFVLCLAFGLTAPTVTLGQEPWKRRWLNPEIPIHVATARLPAGMTATEFIEAVRAAAGRWSFPAVPCTSIKLRVVAEPRRSASREDGTSLVVFRTRRWCHNARCSSGRSFAAWMAAMTTVLPHPKRARGPIREADIELNAVHFDWDPNVHAKATPSRPVTDQGGTRSKPTLPLRAVLIHELGHVLGFEDACAGVRAHSRPRLSGCPKPQRQSVMLASAERPDLTSYDIERLCAAYPARQPATKRERASASAH